MANRYWVGGTGSWDAATTTNWGSASGLADNASVPTSSDDVIFDTLSNATAYTVTITATANCASLTVGAPASGKVTFAGSSALNVFGNINLSGGTTGTTLSYSGQITMKKASGTATITSNGLSFGSNFDFNQSGTTFQLVDDLTTTGQRFYVTAGTFDATTNSRTVTLKNSAPIINPVAGSVTFYNLSCIPTTPAKTNALSLTGNITITNAFTIDNGATVTNRCIVRAFDIANFVPILGTARTITCNGSLSINNADFQDIVGAGSVSWNLASITGNSGDCGGNSGITFTTPATQTWSGTSGGNWSSNAWSGRVPLPQDDVVISSAFSASQTITQDMPRAGKSISFAGATGTPTWTTSTTASIFGSLTLIAGMVLTASTQSYTFSGRSSYTLTTAGNAFSKLLIVEAPGGTLTLQDDLTISGNTLQVTNGTFNDGDNNITAATFASSNSITRTITMGSKTWTLTGTGTVWGCGTSTGLTLTPGTATIKFTNTSATARTFAGGGKTYNRFWHAPGAGSASLTVSGNNTFSELKDDGTTAHSILFTAGSTQTITTWSISGSVGQVITINSTTTSAHSLVKAGGGTVSADYLNIQHSVATPSSTWYAGTHSTNNQATSTAGSGWIFTDPPAGGASATNFFNLFS